MPQGLDPTAKPGNSTSLPDSEQDSSESMSEGYKPRVDVHGERARKKNLEQQVDQEARKLQRNVNGLGQMAGFKNSWRKVTIKKNDPRFPRGSIERDVSVGMYGGYTDEEFRPRCWKCGENARHSIELRDRYYLEEGDPRAPKDGRETRKKNVCTDCLYDLLDESLPDNPIQKQTSIKTAFKWTHTKGKSNIRADRHMFSGACSYCGGYRGEPRGDQYYGSLCPPCDEIAQRLEKAHDAGDHSSCGGHKGGDPEYLSHDYMAQVARKERNVPIKNWPDLAAQTYAHIVNDHKINARPGHDTERITPAFINQTHARLHSSPAIEDRKSMYRTCGNCGIDLWHDYLSAPFPGSGAKQGWTHTENINKIPKRDRPIPCDDPKPEWKKLLPDHQHPGDPRLPKGVESEFPPPPPPPKPRQVHALPCPSCESDKTRGRYTRGGWREYDCTDCGHTWKSQKAGHKGGELQPVECPSCIESYNDQATGRCPGCSYIGAGQESIAQGEHNDPCGGACRGRFLKHSDCPDCHGTLRVPSGIETGDPRYDQGADTAVCGSRYHGKPEGCPECPDCDGTGKCRTCKGKAVIYYDPSHPSHESSVAEFLGFRQTIVHEGNHGRKAR